MILSALLKSFSQIAQEKPRRKAARYSALAVEIVEERFLLSTVNSLPLLNSNGTSNSGGESNPLTAIPRLSSNPAAPVTLYLDFNGHTETDASWTNNGARVVSTPVYDNDNDLTTFSDDELRRMEEIWYRVAEDFTPFNVNVTTVDPGAFNDFQGIRISIGGAGGWLGGVAGGVALIDAFNNSSRSNTCFVFTDNLQDATGNGAVVPTAMNASHEAGHTFGLNHHSEYNASGNKLQEYNPGTTRLGPIMGGAFYSERNTWNNGPANVSVNALQDDLAVLTRVQNQTFRYRTDDYGNTIATATNLPVTSTRINRNGVIERNTDADIFAFTTDTGAISFTAEGLNLRRIYANQGLNFGSNLDIVLRLYNSAGTVIASAAPTNSLFASVTANVTQGTYYIGVSGTGEYGALGQYTLAGNVIPLPALPTMASPSGTSAFIKPVFAWSAAANAASYQLEVDNLTTGVNRYYTASVTTTSNASTKSFAEGNYRSRVRSVAPNGTTSAWSPYLLFTIDVPTPSTPTILRPKGLIGESFPTFEWTPVPFSARYELLVTRTDTNQRVIFRTNYGRTSYVHFSPLVDATYQVTVRAGNALNQYSAWSIPVSVTVKSPIPAAPRFSAPGKVTTSTNPRFVWNAVAGVAWYDLKVDNLSTGRTDFIRQQRLPRTSTFYDPSYMTQGSYKAFIRGVNGNGVAGPWSAEYVFNVDILPPDVPVMTGPRGAADSPTVITTNPLFTWTRVARAVKYELLVNNLTTQTARVISNNNLSTNSYLSIGNMAQGNYRAWVRGINAAKEVGYWSSPLDFTIDEPTPSTPVMIAPQANTLNYVENANPTFVWEAIPPAFAYEFMLVNVSLNQTAVSVTGLKTPQYRIPADKTLGEYTYVARARSVNSSGDKSDWSADFRIVVNVPNPTTPTLIGPGETLTDRTPVFSWTHTSTSFRYELLVRDLVRGEDITVQVTTFQLAPGGTRASYTLPESKALVSSTYRFWVRAFNSQGQASGWSTSKTFVIAAQLDGNLLQLEQGDISREVLTATARVTKAESEAVPAIPQPAEYVVYAGVSTVNAAGFPETNQTASSRFAVSMDDDSEEFALIDAVMRRIADPAGDLDLSAQRS